MRRGRIFIPKSYEQVLTLVALSQLNPSISRNHYGRVQDTGSSGEQYEILVYPGLPEPYTVPVS